MTMEPFEDKEEGQTPEMRDPVLITSFTSQEKGGQTGPTALTYALEQWDGEFVTRIEADECYNFTRIRPWVRRDGDQTVIDWPQNVVYRVEGDDRTFLVLIGVEPSLNWHSFVKRIDDFATQHDVKLAVNVKSVPATIPHTLEAPVQAIYSEAGMEDEFGLAVLEDQEGPADIGRVLNLHLASKGVRTIDIYALEPFYAAASPDAEASISILRSLQKAFGLYVHDLARLEQAAALQRRAIDAAVNSSKQLRDTVAALEERAGSKRALLAAPEAEESGLDASDVLSEAEAFLRSLSNESEEDATES